MINDIACILLVIFLCLLCPVFTPVLGVLLFTYLNEKYFSNGGSRWKR